MADGDTPNGFIGGVLHPSADLDPPNTSRFSMAQLPHLAQASSTFGGEQVLQSMQQRIHTSALWNVQPQFQLPIRFPIRQYEPATDFDAQARLGPAVQDPTSNEEAAQEKVASDDDLDVFGRRRGPKKKASSQGSIGNAEVGEAVPLTKAQRQKAALDRLRAPKRPLSPSRKLPQSVEPHEMSTLDVVPDSSAAVVRKPRKEGNLEFMSDTWRCQHCGWMNRNLNARCGGAGSLGCKRERYS